MRHPIASVDISDRLARALDRGANGGKAVVFDQAIAVAGVGQALDDLGVLELAAGDELEEPEGAAVERVRCACPAAAAARLAISRSSAA